MGADKQVHSARYTLVEFVYLAVSGVIYLVSDVVDHNSDLNRLLHPFCAFA